MLLLIRVIETRCCFNVDIINPFENKVRTNTNCFLMMHISNGFDLIREITGDYLDYWI